jgi:hypothetical protein
MLPEVWKAGAMNALLAVLLAAAPLNPGSGASLLGWSGTGEFLVWTRSDTEGSPAHHYFRKIGNKRVEIPASVVLTMSDADFRGVTQTVADEESGDWQTDERATLAVAHSLRTGQDLTWVLSIEKLTVQARDKLKTKYADTPDGAAFEAWKKSVGGVARVDGLDGPDGAKAFVKVDGRDKATWVTEDVRKISIGITRGADKASEAWEDGMEAMFTPHRSVSVVWDGKGRRALFIIETAEARTMRGTVGPSWEYRVLTAPPRIEVVATARLEPEARRIASELEKNGFTVSAVATAMKERTATVIYSDDAHRELAQKVSAALPGSTLDKLTWKANGEVVVAVGAPLVAPPK